MATPAGPAGVAYELGDLAAAIAELTAAVEAAPGDAGLRYNVGFAYHSAQRRTDALAHLDTAAEPADDPDVNQVREECRARVAVVAQG